MREIIQVMKANIRSAKSNFLSVILLMFVVSVALTTVLTVNINSSNRNKEAIENAGFGDLWAGFNNYNVEQNGTSITDIIEQINGCEETAKVKAIDCTYVNIKDLNGYENSSTVILQNYYSKEISYQIFSEDGKSLQDDLPKLNKGEIAVPISYQSLYDCKLGDMLTINNNGENMSFTVKYFFEDPFMGSSMMGLKTLLISNMDLDTLLTISKENPTGSIQQGTILNIFKSDKYNFTGTQFVQSLNKQTNFTAYAYNTLTTSQAISYMLIIIHIFSGILFAFVILLLIVTLIVIGHNINNSIEMDYVNLGILKALGFTGRKLKLIHMVQYFLAVLIGSILGIPAAVPVIKIINEMTKPVTGLQISDNFAIVPCLGILITIMLFVILYVWVKLRKMERITPVRAITGGKDEVYFKSLIQLPIKKPGLNFWLAYRQLTSNIKQYISACVIAAILVFFLSMVSGMSLWVGDDGRNLNQMFSAFDNDVNVVYFDDSIRDEVEEKINSNSEIIQHFSVWSKYMLINDCQVYSYVCDSPDMFNTILSGRTCLYDNEIIITEFLAEELKVHIGDTVNISIDDYSADFMISGFYQCANDMGSNFAMNTDGYQRLTGNSLATMVDIYNLADNSNIENIVDKISKEYSEDDIKITDGGVFDGMQSIVMAVKGISVIIYVIAVVFVLITVYMMCGKIFIRERKDYGIYKAMGFTAKKLRLQFAFRFALIATVGSLLGLILNLCFSNVCCEFLFSYMGVSKFSVDTGVLPNVLPIIFMIVIFFVFSYILSRKIRKIETRILISE